MTVLTSTHAQNLLTEAQGIKARMDAEATRLKVITNYLTELVGNETGTHTVQGVGDFVVSENNTYDAEAMKAALLPGQVKRCMVATLDKAVVKRLYGDVYTAAKRSNGHKVTVK